MSLVEESMAVANDFGTPYACPFTGQPLLLNGESLRSGQRSYPIVNGIPHFLEYAPAESEQTLEQLRQLNEICRAEGWRAALERVYGKDSNMFQYVTSTKRAAFLDFLPFTSSSAVMEIGAGLGQFTPLLAARSRMVYALEVVAGQAEFIAGRCAQEGAHNVSVACGGDNCRLPYADESFDGIICNLVFEWCAYREQENPRAVQRRFLREMARVLKPGGFLYLATKNRFALRYLLGGKDEHVQHLRFGSALPESIQRFALRVLGKSKATGHLYSYRALKHLMSQEQLDVIRSYWASPEFRHPEQIIPTDSRSIRQRRSAGKFKQGDTRLTALLMPLVPAFVVKHVTPGLAFVALKRKKA